MATLAVIPRPARLPDVVVGHPCACGEAMRRGVRYELTRTVDVLLCHSCWAEDPPLYPTRPAPRGALTKVCEQCARPYPVHPSTLHLRRFCTRGCQNAWFSLHRKTRPRPRRRAS